MQRDVLASSSSAGKNGRSGGDGEEQDPNAERRKKWDDLDAFYGQDQDDDDDDDDEDDEEDDEEEDGDGDGDGGEASPNSEEDSDEDDTEGEEDELRDEEQANGTAASTGTRGERPRYGVEDIEGPPPANWR